MPQIIYPDASPDQVSESYCGGYIQVQPVPGGIGYLVTVQVLMNGRIINNAMSTFPDIDTALYAGRKAIDIAWQEGEEDAAIWKMRLAYADIASLLRSERVYDFTTEKEQRMPGALPLIEHKGYKIKVKTADVEENPEKPYVWEITKFRPVTEYTYLRSEDEQFASPDDAVAAAIKLIDDKVAKKEAEANAKSRGTTGSVGEPESGANEEGAKPPGRKGTGRGPKAQLDRTAESRQPNRAEPTAV